MLCATEHLLLAVARLYIDTRHPLHISLRPLTMLCPAGPMLWACEGSHWPAIEQMPRGVKRALASGDYDALAALVAKHLWCTRTHGASVVLTYCRCRGTVDAYNCRCRGAVDGLLFDWFIVRVANATGERQVRDEVLVPLVSRWLVLFERWCPRAQFRRSMRCATAFLTDRCRHQRPTPYPRALAGVLLHALEPAKALRCLRHLATIRQTNLGRFEDPLPDLQRLFGRWCGLRAAWVTAAVSSPLPAAAADDVGLPRRAKQPRRA